MTSLAELVMVYDKCDDLNMIDEARKVRQVINRILDNTLVDLESKEVSGAEEQAVA